MKNLLPILIVTMLILSGVGAIAQMKGDDHFMRNLHEVDVNAQDSSSLVLEHIRGDYTNITHNVTGGQISRTISNKWVEGDIIIIVENCAVNKIEILVHNNPIVYGDIHIIVYNNNANDIKVETYNNGGNINDDTKNQVVGGSILVEFQDNWAFDNFIAVDRNWVHNDINVSVNLTNELSDLRLDVKYNRVGRDTLINIDSNVIDDYLGVTVMSNIVAQYMEIAIFGNKIGWYTIPTFATFKFEVYDNHVAENHLHILVYANEHHGPIFDGRIYKNGAKDNITIVVSSNEDWSISDFKFTIYENMCGNNMSIIVNGNKFFKSYKIIIRNNKAGLKKPEPDSQGDPGDVHDNILYHPQTSKFDDDSDGLTDEYERMIGTNPGDPDTDHDGFYDGWNEHWLSPNRMWNGSIGERYGEVGDPLHDFNGSISKMFNQPGHNPNPLNKDIYVEIDYCPNAASFNVKELDPVVDIFAKHCIRLHIDTGWPVGTPYSTQEKGGGQPLPAEPIRFPWRQPPGNYVYTHFYHPDYPRIRHRKILGRFNDFYDYKVCCLDRNNGVNQPHWTEYFDGALNGIREDIFHYCVAAEYIVRYREINNRVTLDYLYSTNLYGMADIGGDDMILAYSRIKQNSKSLEKIFMHELGHNLNLRHTTADKLTDDEMMNETVMNSPASEAIKTDYLLKEWSSLDLTGVEDGRARRGKWWS